MSFSIELIGKDRLKAVLARMEQGLDPNITKALETVADKVKNDAKEFCPVGTPASTGIPGYIGGSLKKSIRREAVARPAGNKWEIGVRAGGYITNPNTKKIVHYARFVEFGTSRMFPRPFLRSAVQANAEMIRRAMAQALGDTLEEGVGE
jgi:HK97 gp10 family phage protein